MAVCRVEKSTDYTTMSNYHLRDTRLTLKAKGLLSLILSLPEDWDYTIAGLAHICREGKDAVRAAVAELENSGYIQRNQTHDESGAFSGNEYVIFEAPQPPLSDYPTTGNPSTEKPLTENPTESNKDKPSKDIYTPLKSPQGGTGGRKRKEPLPDWEPDRFEKFWRLYPKRESNANQKKADARRAWNQLRPDDDLIGYMGKVLVLQMKTRQWNDGVGVPYASTWIRAFGKDELPDLDTLMALGSGTSPGGWAPDPEVMTNG